MSSWNGGEQRRLERTVDVVLALALVGLVLLSAGALALLVCAIRRFLG